MQGLVQDDASVIAGKGTPSGIGAMQPRSKTHHQQVWLRVSKWRHRPGVVTGIFSFDPVQVPGETGTAAALRVEARHSRYNPGLRTIVDLELFSK